MTKPKNEGRIFQAWCGGQYRFIREDDGRLSVKVYHSYSQIMIDWKNMERAMARRLRERPDKSEYFANLHSNAQLMEELLTHQAQPKVERMSTYRIPLDWD